MCVKYGGPPILRGGVVLVAYLLTRQEPADRITGDKKGIFMRLPVLILLPLLLVAVPCIGAEQSVTVHRITGKLWRVIEITREYTPQFQAHVILEAPDRQRLAITLRDETARTLISNDIIVLEPKQEAPAVIPEEKMGDFFTSTLVKQGRSRWWKAWLNEQTKEIEKGLRQLLEPKKDGETEI